MTLAAPCVSLSLAGIPVMMTACRGHGPGTKHGYLWLMENITGATCLQGWLLRLWGWNQLEGDVQPGPLVSPSCSGPGKSISLSVLFLPGVSTATCLGPRRGRSRCYFVQPLLCCFWTSLCTVILAAFLGPDAESALFFLCLPMPGWWARLSDNRLVLMKCGRGHRPSTALGAQGHGFVTWKNSPPPWVSVLSHEMEEVNR